MFHIIKLEKKENSTIKTINKLKQKMMKRNYYIFFKYVYLRFKKLFP